MSPKAKNVIEDAVADINRDMLRTTVTKSERIEIRASLHEKREIHEIAESVELTVAEYLLGLHRHAYPKLTQHRRSLGGRAEVRE